MPKSIIAAVSNFIATPMVIIDRFNGETLLRTKGSTRAHLDRSAKTAQTIRGKMYCDHEWHLGLGEKGNNVTPPIIAIVS